MFKTVLVTSALPYANGDLHLGHMLEFIQTDIWVRYSRLFNLNCVHVSGCDAHGTPIMLKALSQFSLPESLISECEISHKRSLLSYNISFDNFYTTHSYESENLSRRMFYRLYERGYIDIKNISQLYDPIKKFFLPDRYVKGICPKCKSIDQYGDVCEKCSYRYDAIDLIKPISVLSGVAPIKRFSRHYFFNLSKFENFLQNWCKTRLSQNEIINKLSEWFSIGLKSWDISRDIPYFGFKIPGEHDKYFYVWLDAPIGYFASFQKLFFDKFLFFDRLNKSKGVQLYHFIGKDILYFHSLFWPAVLNGVDFKLPTDVFVHGFLTINGKKMSKSSGTFIMADEFVKFIDADYLRYYLASKLNNSVSDIDFNFDDFLSRINSELIGKFLNIFIRCSKIIIKNYNSVLSDKIIDYSLFHEYLKIKDILKPLYYSRQYSKVVFYVMKYAEKINIYIDKEKPWYLIKDINTRQMAHDVCTLCINLFIILLINLKPIIPKISKSIENLFYVRNLSCNDLSMPLLSIKIKKYIYIAKRLNKSDFSFL